MKLINVTFLEEESPTLNSRKRDSNKVCAKLKAKKTTSSGGTTIFIGGRRKRIPEKLCTNFILRT